MAKYLKVPKFLIVIDGVKFKKRKRKKKEKSRGGITIRPCHLHFKKYVKAKRRIMETQIFHHTKILLIFK
jgi:hypothetical protein